MTGGSLRLRLIAGGAAAIFVALIVAGIGLALLFERHVTRSLTNDLEVDLRQAIGSLEISAGGRLLLKREPSNPRFSEPLSGLYWQISTAAGGLTRSRSLWDSTLPLPHDALAPGDVHYHRVIGPRNTDLIAVERTVVVSMNSNPTAVRLVFAADTAGIAGARRAFVGDLVPALALLGLVLGAATWIQIGLGLKPLERLRDRIAAVRQGLSPRLEGPVPSEVEPLVDEINGLLAAQTREVERARGRAADLAHGLKTPLAALAADARSLEEKGDREVATRLMEVSEAMRRHVDRELARARIRGSRGLGGVAPTLMRPLVESLLSIQRRSIDRRSLSFETDFSGEPSVRIDKTDLAEVLGNLIENAARHARSCVRIGCRGDGVIYVEDDGQGIAEADRANAVERGKRLDEKGDGSGLGLAIVQEVLDAYGRKLTLETSNLGGLRAVF
ncbi:HAMP domain-containing histidine kinase [Patescibacteria group bacterium]|nr:HAMP domain-containing histidine kinase [Patescibacteria group bacterium]